MVVGKGRTFALAFGKRTGDRGSDDLRVFFSAPRVSSLTDWNKVSQIDRGSEAAMPSRIQKPKERQAQRQFHRTEGLAVVQTILKIENTIFYSEEFDPGSG